MPVEAPPPFAPVAAAFARDRELTLEKGWGAGNVVLKVKGKIFPRAPPPPRPGP